MPGATYLPQQQQQELSGFVSSSPNFASIYNSAVVAVILFLWGVPSRSPEAYEMHTTSTTKMTCSQTIVPETNGFILSNNAACSPSPALPWLLARQIAACEASRHACCGSYHVDGVLTYALPVSDISCLVTHRIFVCFSLLFDVSSSTCLTALIPTGSTTPLWILRYA